MSQKNILLAREQIKSYSLLNSTSFRQNLILLLADDQTSDLDGIVELTFNTLVKDSEKVLNGIFGGTFVTIHTEPKPSEHDILDKFLIYLVLRLYCKSEYCNKNRY